MVDQQLDLAVALLVGPGPAQAAALAARPLRSRARRSGLTSRASCLPAAPGTVSFGGTRTSSSPRLSSCRSSQRVSCRQSSTAHKPLTVERRRPAEQLLASDRDRRLVEHPPGLVDRDRGHRLLVYVHSDHDHLDRLLLPLGATGERTDLNRGESHAPIRSRSTVSDGGGDTTLGSQPSGDIRNRVSRRRPSLSTTTGRCHPPENDIEFRNVT